MIDRRSLLRFLATAMATTAAPLAAHAQAEAPAVATIKTYYDTLLGVMKDATKLGFKGRYDKLGPAIRKAFNLPLMTRLSVGPDWTKLAADVQQRLVTAFSDMSISTYASRFDGYDGEHFEVDPKPASTTGGVIVSTKLVQTNGDPPVQLNYLMRDGDAGWQIIDVFLQGTISELATRRSEFSTVLRRDGPDALVKLIQTRADALKKPA